MVRIFHLPNESYKGKLAIIINEGMSNCKPNQGYYGLGDNCQFPIVLLKPH